MTSQFMIDLSGLDLLVVEDDSTSAHILSRALIKQGARVEIAADGKAGLLKFQEQHFPIVITDINMPGINGLELAGHIKKIDPDTLIIATSVNDDTDCIITALELGFSDYFLKPFTIKKIILAVKRCLDVITVKKQLENERKQFKTVLECLGEAILIKDLDYQILYQNRAMREMFGVHLNTACYKIFTLETSSDDYPTVLAMKDGLNHTACHSFQLDGTTYHIESTASLLRDSDGIVTGTVEIIRDISLRIKNEQTIREMAFLDPLTGLSNRRLFKDRLVQAIAKSRRYGNKFGLVSLDLDNFKDINDNLGHDAGDLVLVEAAERIRTCCKRDIDTIGRQGGDEFCIIVADCGDRDQLAAIAQNLLLQLSLPLHLADTHVEMTASIGISIYPEHGSDMKELEIASDRAMYAAKKAGRNTFRFWEPLTTINTNAVANQEY